MADDEVLLVAEVPMSDPERGVVRLKREFLLALSMLHALLTTGMMFGWPSLLPIFFREGQFDELCTNSSTATTSATLPVVSPYGTPMPPAGPHSVEPKCGEQQTHLSWVYTSGAVASVVSQLPLGLLFDRFGPRLLALGASVGFMLGVVLLAVADSKTFDSFFAAFFFLGFCGPAMQFSGAHVAALFPQRRGFIMTLFPGCFNGSAFILPTLAAIMARTGFTRQQMFLSYLLPLALVVLGVIWCAPDRKYVEGDVPVLRWPPWRGTALMPNETLRRVGIPSLNEERLQSRRASADSDTSAVVLGQLAFDDNTLGDVDELSASEPSASDASNNDNHRRRSESNGIVQVERRSYESIFGRALPDSLVGIMLRPEYIFLLITNAMHVIRVNFMQGSMADQLFAKGDTSYSMLPVYSALVPAMSIGVFVVGPLVDRLGVLWTLALVAIHGVAYGFLFLVENLNFFYFFFAFASLARPFAFGTLFAYVASVYGLRKYGLLIGFINTISGAISMVQFFLFFMTFELLDGDFRAVNLLLALLSLVTVAFVCFLFWTKRRTDRHMRENLRRSGALRTTLDKSTVSRTIVYSDVSRVHDLQDDYALVVDGDVT